MAKECYRPRKTGDEYDVLKGEQPAATDDEVCVYLYTAAQTPDGPGLVSNLPLYYPTNNYSRSGKHKMSEDTRVNSLNEYRIAGLSCLKE